MSLMEILALATGLSMDAFSVCVASAAILPKIRLRHYLSFSFHFGLFQFLMPLAGFYAGGALKALNYWAAFAILALIGANMIRGGLSKNKETKLRGDPSRGFHVILLSLATSIDAAAAGVSIAALNTEIFFPAAIIGAVCAAFSAGGVFTGSKMRRFSGNKTGIFGGLILIAIAFKILAQNLL